MRAVLRSSDLPIVRRHRMLSPILVLICCPVALSDDLQKQDQLVWDFAEFVESFSAKDWSKVAQFVGADTKVGFGGEMGFEGFMQVFGEDDYCFDAMLRALNMGCRKAGIAEQMRCIAPPQLGPDVVYLGARASFRFSTENGRWVAESLICGGD